VTLSIRHPMDIELETSFYFGETHPFSSTAAVGGYFGLHCRGAERRLERINAQTR
jgi:hypothetical protein